MLEATCHLWCLTMLRWECVLDTGTSVPVCITLRRGVKKAGLRSSPSSFVGERPQGALLYRKACCANGQG